MGYSYHGRGTHSCLCHNMTLNALSSAVPLLLRLPVQLRDCANVLSILLVLLFIVICVGIMSIGGVVKAFSVLVYHSMFPTLTIHMSLTHM